MAACLMIPETRSGRSDISPCIASSQAHMATVTARVEPDRNSAARKSEKPRASPSPPLGAERVGVRWGASGCGVAHLTLPIAHATGPLPLPPQSGGEGKRSANRVGAGGSFSATGNSEAPHQPHETALNLDAVGSEDPGLIGLVGRLEGDRVTAAAQPFEGDLLIVDQSDDDAAGFRGVAALND